MPAPQARVISPPGEIKYTLGATVLCGEVICRPAAANGTSVGIVLGMNAESFVSGTEVTLQTTGVVELPAITGTAFTDDLLLYWDDTNNLLTNVATGNCRAGRAVGAKGSAVNRARVNLNVV